MFHFRKTLFIFLDAVMSKCGHEQHLKINNHTGWHNFCFFFSETRQEEKNIHNHACLSVDGEDDGRKIIMQGQQRNCVYDRRRTEKKNTTLWNAFAVFQIIVWKAVGATLCGLNITRLHTHTKHKTGPLMGARTSTGLCLSRSTSAGCNKTRERFFKTDYCDWFI